MAQIRADEITALLSQKIANYISGHSSSASGMTACGWKADIRIITQAPARTAPQVYRHRLLMRARSQLHENPL